MFKNQKGVGLIEVLITLLVLATALLTITTLHVKSLQYNHSSYIKSQANVLASDLSDRMRLNRYNISSYSLTFDGALPAITDLATQDLNEWGGLLASLLPNGRGQVSCKSVTVTTHMCTVGIKWGEAGLTSDSGDVNSDNVLYYTMEI